MKILVIEDNQQKLDRTLEYINKVSKESNVIDTVDCIMEAHRSLRTKKYDRVVIDMQLPMRTEQSIEIEGGINILLKLFLEDNLNHATKRVINTSAEDTIKTLEKHGFGKEKMIVNSSMYDCTSEFDKFINN